MTAVRGWSTQPTLVELENMLADQETLTKQTAEDSPRKEGEALFGSHKKVRSNFKTKPKGEGRPNQQRRPNQWSNNSGGARNHPKGDDNQDDRCYNCGKKGHYKRDCWHLKKKCQGNIAVFKNQQGKNQEDNKSEEEWDADAAFAVAAEIQVEDKEGEVALMALSKSGTIDYNNDWIIDSGCSNHMTGDIKKLEDLEKYKGRQVIVTANNSKLPINYIGKTKISPRFNSQPIKLDVSTMFPV